MKNILITGGCGFIGLNLIGRLRERYPDYKLTVLDNLSLGKREYLNEFEVEFVEGDIRDSSIVNKTMVDKTSVVHLAADTRVLDSIENPQHNFDVNVNGTFNLLQSAREHEVKSFIMASTGGAILGDVKPPVNESMVPRPISPYGASKLMAEGYLSAFHGSYGMNTVALRFSNVYGPRSYLKGSVVAVIFKKILNNEEFTVYGDGTQTRDYVYVEDIADAICLGIHTEKGGDAYQLGTAEGTSLNRLLDIINSVTGAGLKVNYEPFRTGEILHNFTEIELARSELGYDPAVSLEQGIAMTWDWFKKLS